MNISKQKEKIRERLLVERTNMPEREYRESSGEIRKKLVQQPEFRQARTVDVYIAMNSRNEVDTYPLIQKMLGAGKKVVVPVTEFASGDLRHIELKSLDDLAPNKWGVPEPNGGEEVDLTTLDLVIVPMVGGDEQCNRIGYGKGFYDRFLARVECSTIGLCFERCIVKEIPTEPFDIRLKKIVTETRVIGWI